MATIFVKWPGFKGSATAAGYEDWSEAKGLSYGIERRVTQSTAAATNREAARPELSQIVITKRADTASPKLFELSVAGEPAEVEIHLCTAGGNDGGDMRPYIRYRLHKCIVAGYDCDGDPELVPIENVTLAFEKVEYEFDVFKADNKTLETTVKTQYDLKTNVLA